MGDPFEDYDYPSSSKPVEFCKQESILSTRNSPYSLSTSCHNLQSVSVLSHPLQNHSNRTHLIKTGQFSKSNLDFNILDLPISLDDGIYSDSKGCYYDIPKNIPVNPQFVNLESPLVGPVKFPVHKAKTDKPSSSSPPTPPSIPNLPKKSQAVIAKMSNYSKLNFPIRPEPVRTLNLSQAPQLSKQNTSKPLPLLPDEVDQRRKAMETYSIPVGNKPKSDSAENIIPTLKFMDIYDAEDFDNDCDYEYDYVCLESKRKLEGEDKKVHMLIPKHLQQKYEHLVLKSSDTFNLDAVEKPLSKSILNEKHNSQIVLLYRYRITSCIFYFTSWASITKQIVEQTQLPEVFFNFAKHILLSGQTLLLIIKSLCRNLQTSKLYTDISDFSIKLFDCLKSIVLKAKLATNQYANPKYKQDLIECVHNSTLICSSIQQLLLQFK